VPVGAAAALVIVSALFIDRYGAIDELGLFNPAYMFARAGRMTYPAHYFPDEMVVHPPTHYFEVGLLLKSGIPLYYAEALPAVAWHLVAVAAIVFAPFTRATQVALLLGLCAPIVLFHNSAMQLELFGMRPEGELNAAWLAGLVMIESSRRLSWRRRWLVAGSAALTFAAALHYYAAPAVLTACGYIAWALFETPRQHRRSILVAGAAGISIVALPIAVTFVVPHWSSIVGMIKSTAGGGDYWAPLTEHLAQYAYWRPKWTSSTSIMFPAGVLTGVTPALASQIPLLGLGLLLLAARRDTRSLAGGAAPLVLTLAFAAQHKHAYYFVHELSLLTTAIWGVLIASVGWLWSKTTWPENAKEVAAFVASCAIAGALVVTGPRAHDVRLTMTPRVHEAEVARAAGRAILGPAAVVGGRIGSWYIAGEQHWLGLERGWFWEAPDDTSVIRRFDAVVETVHMSNVRLGGVDGPIPAALYADGTLHLVGFYFASDANTSMSYVLLGAEPLPNVVGFGSDAHTTFQIRQDESGNNVLSTADCSYSAVVELNKRAKFRQALVFTGPSEEARYAVTAVTGSSPLPAECRIVRTWRVAVTPIDRDGMLEKARRSDALIQFHQQLAELPPPRAGSHPSAPATVQ
jgi:hypothetical protein